MTFKIRRSKTPNIKNTWEKSFKKNKMLGEGVCARVFALNNVKVVKYFNNDPAYVVFLKELAKLKKENPFFPKIYSVELVDEVSGKVVMEALKENCDGWENDDNGDEIFIQNAILSRNTYGMTKENFCLFNKDFTQAIEFLRKTYKKVRAIGNNSWHGLDLHSGNLMIRKKDGHIVITDPFN